MLKYTSNVVVTLNRFNTDTDEEISLVKKYVEDKEVSFAVTNSYTNGGQGAIELANKVINTCENASDFKYLYDNKLSIKDKIAIIAHEIYRANDVNYESDALKHIEEIESLGLDKLPVCIAKTQYSISDNPKLLGHPQNHVITVTDINVYSGAEFIVVYLGKIMTMPGLGRHSNYENISIDENYNIEGLF